MDTAPVPIKAHANATRILMELIVICAPVAVLGLTVKQVITFFSSIKTQILIYITLFSSNKLPFSL